MPPRHELHPQSPWESGLTPRAIEEAPRSLNSLLCPKGGHAERGVPAQPQLKAVQAPRAFQNAGRRGCGDLHPERLAPAGWQEASRCSHRGAGHPRSTPPRPRRAVTTSWTAAQPEAQRQERLRSPPATRCGRKGSPHTTQGQGQRAQGLQPASRSRGHACYSGYKFLFLLLATELHFLCVFPPFNKNTEAHQVRSQHPASAQTRSKKTQKRGRLARTPSTGCPQARSQDVRSWRPETELCPPEGPGDEREEEPEERQAKGGRARREPGGTSGRQRGETELTPHGPAPCTACTVLPEPSAQPRTPGHLRLVLCWPRGAQKLCPREPPADAAASPGTSARGFLPHRHPTHREAERRPSQLGHLWASG